MIPAPEIPGQPRLILFLPARSGEFFPPAGGGCWKVVASAPPPFAPLSHLSCSRDIKSADPAVSQTPGRGASFGLVRSASARIGIGGGIGIRLAL
ncbi:hypothetical protein MLD38_001980 [Melastoma candidum]|uniref:Uncharacterized protein n=1 Tax=Melastoma candidum TaxID=119954 RepID=A0ACB9SI92_9MYRT|nr:hypothetical protein MLD38_001980 [Melastoma candidum]